jgi:hypothetical protein
MMKRYYIMTIVSALFLAHANTIQSAELDSVPAVETPVDLEPELPKVLTPQEKTAISILGGVMDIAAARIDASTCMQHRGVFYLELTANGVPGQRVQNNIAKTRLKDSTISVMGSPLENNPDEGSNVLVEYTRTTSLSNFDPIIGYQALYSFSPALDMLTVDGNLNSRNRYNEYFSYTLGAIVSLNRSEPNLTPDDPETSALNTGWGMNWHSNPEDPQSKYWQRIIIQRDINDRAKTVVVRDLLTHSSLTCRIKIDISGFNNPDFFLQTGYLTIDTAKPTDPLYF